MERKAPTKVRLEFEFAVEWTLESEGQRGRSVRFAWNPSISVREHCVLRPDGWPRALRREAAGARGLLGPPKQRKPKTIAASDASV